MVRCMRLTNVKSNGINIHDWNRINIPWFCNIYKTTIETEIPSLCIEQQ